MDLLTHVLNLARVGEVAIHVGYRSAAGFSKAFKRLFARRQKKEPPEGAQIFGTLFRGYLFNILYFTRFGVSSLPNFFIIIAS